MGGGERLPCQALADRTMDDTHEAGSEDEGDEDPASIDANSASNVSNPLAFNTKW